MLEEEDIPRGKKTVILQLVLHTSIWLRTDLLILALLDVIFPKVIDFRRTLDYRVNKVLRPAVVVRILRKHDHTKYDACQRKVIAGRRLIYLTVK